MRIFVDADACPVKDEVYRVAARYGASVAVVANAFLRVPRDPAIELVVVAEGPDVADDWIAERAGPGDVVVTADIPLADRALRAGAQAVSPTGKPFTASNIGGALAGRAVGEHLRSIGETTRGPAPFTPADRSRFLQALDAAMGRARRDAAGRP
ncbi:MAG TPA: YaiI/YqxD family protein [Salinarimonas sp.]|nr:YaiI/YqxD family protein [Salinarimonas sp.]